MVAFAQAPSKNCNCHGGSAQCLGALQQIVQGDLPLSDKGT